MPGPSQAELTASPAPGLLFEEGGCRCVVAASGTLHPAGITPEQGFCFIARPGDAYPGEAMNGGPPSTLRLFEDGTELGTAHALHADIRTKGQGRFSHWGTAVYFAASDNTDPRTNDRTYTWRIALPGR